MSNPKTFRRHIKPCNISKLNIINLIGLKQYKHQPLKNLTSFLNSYIGTRELLYRPTKTQGKDESNNFTRRKRERKSLYILVRRDTRIGIL